MTRFPKTSRTTIALFLTVLATGAPLTAAACPTHDQQAMSCAEGSTYDAESNSCTVVSG